MKFSIAIVLIALIVIPDCSMANPKPGDAAAQQSKASASQSAGAAAKSNDKASASKTATSGTSSKDLSKQTPSATTATTSSAAANKPKAKAAIEKKPAAQSSETTSSKSDASTSKTPSAPAAKPKTEPTKPQSSKKSSATAETDVKDASKENTASTRKEHMPEVRSSKTKDSPPTASKSASSKADPSKSSGAKDDEAEVPTMYDDKEEAMARAKNVRETRKKVLRRESAKVIVLKGNCRGYNLVDRNSFDGLEQVTQKYSTIMKMVQSNIKLAPLVTKVQDILGINYDVMNELAAVKVSSLEVEMTSNLYHKDIVEIMKKPVFTLFKFHQNIDQLMSDAKHRMRFLNNLASCIGYVSMDESKSKILDGILTKGLQQATANKENIKKAIKSMQLPLRRVNDKSFAIHELISSLFVKTENPVKPIDKLISDKKFQASTVQQLNTDAEKLLELMDDATLNDKMDNGILQNLHEMSEGQAELRMNIIRTVVGGHGLSSVQEHDVILPLSRQSSSASEKSRSSIASSEKGKSASTRPSTPSSAARPTRTGSGRSISSFVPKISSPLTYFTSKTGDDLVSPVKLNASPESIRATERDGSEEEWDLAEVDFAEAKKDNKAKNAASSVAAPKNSKDNQSGSGASKEKPKQAKK